MQKLPSRKKMLGVFTLGFTPIIIATAIAVVAAGGLWWYIGRLKEERRVLTEKVGELTSKVETLETANTELSRQITLQADLVRTSQDVSDDHAKKEADVRDRTTAFKEDLSKRTVVITQTAPVTQEQQRNSQARIGTLWASYCDATKDVKRCTDKHVKPDAKQPGGKGLVSLDWLLVPHADQLSKFLDTPGKPVGLNDRFVVKEAQHA